MSEIKVNSIKGVGASTAAITVNNTDGTCTANITNNLSNRNKVINGGMMIHQRGDASATNSSGYLSSDRFLTNNNSSSQVAVTKSTDTPDGFSASTKWDCTSQDTSVAAGNYFLIQHRMEGQNLQDFAKGTSSAKQYALSFYIKATKTGVYTIELEDTDNSRACSKTITVSDTNWNRYSLIFPADTTGALDNDANSSLTINFWLLAGSNFNSGTLQSSAWGTRTDANRVSSSNVNALDSTSNDFFLTGVQLEVGGTVTDFEHRSFGQELALCHRYYQQYPESTGDGYGLIFNGYIPNSTTVQGALIFSEMRSSPTITNSGNFRILHQSSAVTVSSFNYYHSQKTSLNPQAITSSTLTVGQGAMVGADNDTTARIKLSAEL